MLQRQFTVVDNGSFIQFVGVAGTLAEGLTFSLQKQNIAKLQEKLNAGTLSFFMADSTVSSFNYVELIDPDTGLPFVDLATAMTYFLSIGSVAAGGGGSAISADGDTMYSNTTGDFTATVTAGTKDITIVFAPCPQLLELQAFDETNIVSLKLINSTPELITLPISGCTVNLGVITVNNADDNFALGDTVIVTIQGPKKAYIRAWDSIKTLTQNPEYAHTTVPQVLANAVVDPIALVLEAQQPGGPSTDTFENDGSLTPYGENNMLLVGNVVNETKSETTISTAITPNVNVIGTLSNGASWEAGDIGLFEGVARYFVAMDTYKYMTLHYKLRAGANNLLTMRVFGTNDVNADINSRTGWVDMSLFFLGAASITCTNSSVEDIIMPTTPVTLQALLIELSDQLGSSLLPSDIEYTFIVKKA